MNDTENTLFEAMEAFETLAEAVPFTTSETALFFVLLREWNGARRPTVYSKWADYLLKHTGLTKNSLAAARNKLIQRGVISYHKAGRRSQPLYSLNPLFGLPEPDWLFPKSSHNGGHKPSITVGINPASKQVQEKEKDQGGKNSENPKPETLPELINSLRDCWKGMAWSSIQSHDLLEVRSGFDGFPWDLVRKYLASADPKFLPSRDRFVLDQGRSILSRLDLSEVRSTRSAELLPNIVGASDCPESSRAFAANLAKRAGSGMISLAEARRRWSAHLAEQSVSVNP